MWVGFLIAIVIMICWLGVLKCMYVDMKDMGPWMACVLCLTQHAPVVRVALPAVEQEGEAGVGLCFVFVCLGECLGGSRKSLHTCMHRNNPIDPSIQSTTDHNAQQIFVKLPAP